MKVNISQILAHETCPTLWDATYNHGRGQPQTRTMRFGTRWHHVVEHDTWTRDPIDTPLEALRLRYGLQLWRAAQREWGIELLETEVAMEMGLGGHTLFGQLDAIVRWNGQYWHLQHKTLAETVPLGRYVRGLQRSWHELAYGLMAREKYAPWGGSIIAVLRKVARKRMGRGMLAVEPVVVRPDAAFATELERRIDTMDSQAHAHALDPPLGIPLPQNRSSCFRYNRVCPLIEVCDGIASLSTVPRVNPLERYKQ